MSEAYFIQVDGHELLHYKCDCGHVWSHEEKYNARFQRDENANISGSPSNPIEVQCPRCLLWFTTEDDE